MKGFCPLASGSKGNCLYLGTEKTKILIDAGISAKQIEIRLSQINVSIEEIKAILITHEHFDHIAALKVLCSKYNIPIFANSDTLKGIYQQFHQAFPGKIFTTNEEFEYADLSIFPFSIHHDTLDPVGFVINHRSFRLGICADLGFVSSLVKQKLKNCDFLYVEANHQPSMVYSSNRSHIYKQRVLGRQGHLSNEACKNLLLSIAHPQLKHVYLGHLSSECNHPELALKIITEACLKKNIKIKLSIAHQDKISTQISFK